MINLDNHETWKDLDPNDFYHKTIHIPQNILIAYEAIVNDNLIKKEYKNIHINSNEFKFSQQIIKNLFPNVFTEEISNETLIINIDKENCVTTENYVNIVRKGFLGDGNGIEVSINQFDNFATPEQCSILIFILDFYGFVAEGIKIAHLAAANLIQKAGALCKAQKSEFNLAKNYAMQFVKENILVTTIDPEYTGILDYINWLTKRLNVCKIDTVKNDQINSLANISQNKILILQRFSLTPDNNLQELKKSFDNKNVKYYDVYSDGKNTLAQTLSLIYFLNITLFYVAMLQNKQV